MFFDVIWHNNTEPPTRDPETQIVLDSNPQGHQLNAFKLQNMFQNFVDKKNLKFYKEKGQTKSKLSSVTTT